MDLTYNFANTDDMLCISVPIENDNICENDEIFNVVLTENDPNVIPVAPTSRSVTIIDNDGQLTFFINV